MNPTYLQKEACFDWAEDWRSRRAHTGLEANLRRTGLNQEQFWSRYASWVEALQHDGYPGVLLDRVMEHVRADSTVLDIGAGTGTFALPLARAARHVTAIEPSPAQAAHLRSAAQREEVRNIAIIERRWEDLASEEPGVHNVVFAIHSLQMDDLTLALRRMCHAASERLLLIHTAGHSLSGVLQELFAIEPGPDYTYPYHILSGLGCHPVVEFVDRDYEVRLDLQMDIFRYNPGLTADQCETLRDHVCRHGMVSIRDGEEWIRRSYRDALISVTS